MPFVLIYLMENVMKTIKIDRFEIEWDGVQMHVGMPENEPDPVLAAADCIEAMAKEIIKMRELLEAVKHHITDNISYDTAEAADTAQRLDEYLDSIPK